MSNDLEAKHVREMAGSIVDLSAWLSANSAHLMASAMVSALGYVVAKSVITGKEEDAIAAVERDIRANILETLKHIADKKGKH